MKKNRPTVGLTGATGFIGSNLARALLKKGFRVKALVRSRRTGANLAGSGVEIVFGSLEKAAALQSLAQECDALIHCAAVVRGREYEDFRIPNVVGTENILHALEGVSNNPRLIMVSSLAARQSELSHYARSKSEAESLLKGRAGTLILRPPPVYGPGDKEMLPLFKLMARGLAVVPGNLDSRVSLIYVADLVAAMIAWLEMDASPEGLFTLADSAENGYSWREILAIASEVFDRRVRGISLPNSLIDAVAHSNVLVSRLVGYAPMLTPEKLRELRHPDWVCSGESFSRQTGWRPEIDFPQGLRLALSRGE